MNASTDASVPPGDKRAIQLDEYVRRHPVGALLTAAGFGLAVVLVARALIPARPRSRAVRLLEDIQHRLASLADDGAHALNQGVDALDTLHLDRKFDKLSRGFKALFHGTTAPRH